MKNPVKDMLASVDRLESYVEECRALAELSKQDGWKALSTKVSNRILQSVNQLCNPDCEDQQVRPLRAEIQTLRWFLLAPKVDDTKLQKAIDRIKDLRSKIERLQRIGIGVGDPQADTLRAEIKEATTELIEP